MSTATLIRPQEKTGTWSAIFPNEQVTEQQSALFVKKLLAVAVSNITYLRAIFPEPAFGDRCLEDLNLKILKDDSMCPGACQVIKWVKGCFDALDKKYLRMLIIGYSHNYVNKLGSTSRAQTSAIIALTSISDHHPNTVIESYTFKFSYADQGGIDIYRNDKKISSAYSAEETKKATIRLLRTIIVLTQTLQSLPDDVMMTMKLLYYDNVTPSDYEPPGFRPAENDSFQFEEEPMNIKVGDISTPFHTVKMRIKTDSKQFEMKEDPITEEVSTDREIPLECDKSMETEDSDKTTADVPDFTKQLIENHPAPINHPSFEAEVPSQFADEPGTKDSAVDTTGSQRSQVSEEGETDDKVRCPCGCNEDDGLMILCARCKIWQHGICFLILKEEDAPAEHLCEICAEDDEDDKNATDPHLRGLSPIAIQATCIWRRALVACTEVNRVVAPDFSKRLGVELTVANGLIYRLEKEGFLKNPVKGKRLGKLVNKEKLLNEGFPKYLTRKTKEPSPKSPSIEMNDPETEVNNLAEKTKKLSLSSRKQKQNTGVESHDEDKHDAGRQQSRKSPRFKQLIQVDDGHEKPEPKTSRKRAISKVDENEFDISNSQDVDYFNSRHRKRKASIASKSIMV